jgi:uncharacterized membrane protein YuzA (DUF378 family)
MNDAGDGGPTAADGGVTADAPDEGTDAGAEAPAEGRTYDGVLGAFPYAFRTSDSRLFRSYAVLGGLATALVVLVFGSALVTLIANTLGTVGGTFTFVRAFYITVGLAIVAPLLAPVLLVARRHRRTGSTGDYDGALGAAGYLFLLSLYLALVISAPPGARSEPPAVLAPAVETLYALPPVAALAPPLLAIGFGYLLHRHYR